MDLFRLAGMVKKNFSRRTSWEAARSMFIFYVSPHTAGVPRGLRVRCKISRKNPGGGVQGMPRTGELLFVTALIP